MDSRAVSNILKVTNLTKVFLKRYNGDNHMEQNFANHNNNSPHSYRVTTDEIMDFLKDHVAAKEDLKDFTTKEDLKILENKMEAGFSSIHSELSEVKRELSMVEERLERLFKIETEDVSAALKDLEDLKKRVDILERQLLRHQPI